jgi:hypothetical protein
MALGGRKSLGLAFGARSILAAEVLATGKGYRAVKSAELTLDGEAAYADPAALGRKLGAWLKDKGFTAREVVAGLPAQWLLIKERQVPPASPEALASILRIQAERDFSLDPAALVIDYIAGDKTENGQAVALAAVLKDRVEQISTVAQAAGLKLMSVTPTVMALSSALGAPNCLYFGANGTELAACQGVKTLRHVAAPGAAENGSLPGELKRLAALNPAQLSAREWTVCEDLGLDAALVLALGQSAGLIFKPSCALKNVEATPECKNALGAIALAVRRFETTGLDFIHSRLEVKAPPKISKRTSWGLAAAAVVLLLAGFLIYDWRALASEVGELRESNAGMKETVEAAKDFVDRFNATRKWYDERPNYLECMRAITLCYPEEGKVWTTNLSVREDLKGVLTGRAADEKSVLDVLDRMKASKYLSDVKMLQMRSAGNKTTDVTFSIGFTFLDVK